MLPIVNFDGTGGSAFDVLVKPLHE